MEREPMFQSQYFEGSVKFGSNCEVQGWTNAAMPGRHRAAYQYCSGNPVNMVDPTGLFDFSGFFDAISNFFTGSSSIDLNNATYDSYQVASNYQVPYSEDVSYTWGNYLDPGTPVDNSGMETAQSTLDLYNTENYQNQRSDINAPNSKYCVFTCQWNTFRMAYNVENNRWLSTQEASDAIKLANSTVFSSTDQGTQYVVENDGQVSSFYELANVFNKNSGTNYRYEFDGYHLSDTPPNVHPEITDEYVRFYTIWVKEISNGVAHNTLYLGLNESTGNYEMLEVWRNKVMPLFPPCETNENKYRWSSHTFYYE